MHKALLMHVLVEIPNNQINIHLQVHGIL
jgi:hypothetical protein